MEIIADDNDKRITAEQAEVIVPDQEMNVAAFTNIKGELHFKLTNEGLVIDFVPVDAKETEGHIPTMSVTYQEIIDGDWLK